MNPRQRRAILLLALATLGLLGVFVLVAGYVSDVRAQVDPKMQVLVLTKPVQAHDGLDDTMLRLATVPRYWAPKRALTDPGQVVNLVAGTDLDPGTVLQAGMLVPPPRLSPSQREIAIMVDAETGVAGKIAPDDRVDIIATYAGNEDAPDQSEVVVPAARIIDVGVAVPKTNGEKVQQANQDSGSAVPVTFALTPEQDLAVTHAETFASEVRLALLPPGGDSSEFTVKDRKFVRKP
jgi:pilus assembly protein CpaB